jgi:hypothetical protein
MSCYHSDHRLLVEHTVEEFIQYSVHYALR